MAVVNTKSTVIGNGDALPAVITTAQLGDGRMRQKRGVVAAVSGDSIASVYRFFRVKSNDIVAQLLLSCDAITTCAADVGLYKTAAAGGAVVDADFFASAQSLATALSNSDITRESGVVTIANMEKPIWEALGLTADPQIEYDVAATLTAAAGSAGGIALIGTVVGRT
jgi:hypothetical protein